MDTQNKTQREIKFRAWDPANAKMYDYEFTKTHLLMPGCSGWEWMQYTGLKDKNGKEIYEGDILKDDYGNIYETNMRLSLDEERVLIIGNIMENPELLENKDGG